jgi:hypothetical protein
MYIHVSGQPYAWCCFKIPLLPGLSWLPESKYINKKEGLLKKDTTHKYEQSGFVYRDALLHKYDEAKAICSLVGLARTVYIHRI